MASNETIFVMDPQKPTIVEKRVFDAPRRLLFEAFTRPAYISRWYGPRGYTVTSCQIDLRPGGGYRIVNRDPNGKELAFRGVFREVKPYDRVVSTWKFEGMPDKEALLTSTFEDREGRTVYACTMLFKSMKDREGYLQAGGNQGASESMDRLEDVLSEELEKSEAPARSMGQQTPARPRHQ